MNTDIRVSVGILTNPKIKRLIRRKGTEGFHNLISLWIYASIHFPSGVFDGLDNEDLMDAAGTSDEAFVGLLVAVKLLDFDGVNYAIHSWKKHNGYAAHSEERSQRARDAANKRWQGKFTENGKKSS